MGEKKIGFLTTLFNTSLWNPKFFRYALYATPVMIAVAIWVFVSDNAAESLPLRILIAVGTVVGAYIGFVLLLWWNAGTQKYWQFKRSRAAGYQH